jgi:hypothetical protein
MNLIWTLVWVVAGAMVSACSLFVPSDDHYLGDPARARGGASGQVHGEGGSGAGRVEGGAIAVAGSGGSASAGVSGAGGTSGTGGEARMAGAAGTAGEEDAGSAGAVICSGEFADCNHAAEDGCEVDLSSSRENCGGCGEAFACAPDETCEQSQCMSVTGCSDGTREGFLPLSSWPTIAGCTARWPRSSLRASKTGSPCGYETNVCAVPADACGTGWHVCASPPYGPTEISSRATETECATQPGAFVAAVGDQYCEPCSVDGAGAACCGERCVQQNGNCIYPGMTAWFGMVNDYINVCGAIESNLVQRGVLCCRAPASDGS